MNTHYLHKNDLKEEYKNVRVLLCKTISLSHVERNRFCYPEQPSFDMCEACVLLHSLDQENTVNYYYE